MRTFTYVMCYFAFVIFSNAILFKIMHWPGASVMLVFGYLMSIVAGAMLLKYKLKENKEEIVNVSKNKSDNILDA
jgi:hypothetical protein